MACKGLRGFFRVALAGLRGDQVSPTHALVNATLVVAGHKAAFPRRHSSGGTLVRDFIHDSLYNPEYGYFASASSVVGTIPTPINFPSLRGKAEYEETIRTLYGVLDGHWLTPVETFQPWYSHAIGEYILRQHMASMPSGPLQIYELGGGSGTNAVCIMNYIKTRAPQVYRTMKYTSVEISKELASRQLTRIRQVQSHKGHFTVELRDAIERPGWGDRNEQRCFVVMLEVLDNLPHDRVTRAGKSAPWMETHVHRQPEESTGTQKQLSSSKATGKVEWEERLQPVSDSYITKCLPAALEYDSQTLTFSRILSNFKLFSTMAQHDILWLPTTCYKLLETLHDARPGMTLIASDFSILPEVQISGLRAPLVASRQGSDTIDHSTYLVPKGTCDIFFPTDFGLLQKIDRIVSRDAAQHKANTADEERRRSIVVTQKEFMEKYAYEYLHETVTESGFNPLLDAYSNASFYLSVPYQPCISRITTPKS